MVREQIAGEEPDAPQLEKPESTFRKVSVVLIKWLARNADLAIDEANNTGIGVARWSAVAALADEVAGERAKLVSHILRTETSRASADRRW